MEELVHFKEQANKNLQIQMDYEKKFKREFSKATFGLLEPYGDMVMKFGGAAHSHIKRELLLEKTILLLQAIISDDETN